MSSTKFCPTYFCAKWNQDVEMSWNGERGKLEFNHNINSRIRSNLSQNTAHIEILPTLKSQSSSDKKGKSNCRRH